MYKIYAKREDGFPYKLNLPTGVVTGVVNVKTGIEALEHARSLVSKYNA